MIPKFNYQPIKDLAGHVKQQGSKEKYYLPGQEPVEPKLMEEPYNEPNTEH